MEERLLWAIYFYEHLQRHSSRGVVVNINAALRQHVTNQITVTFWYRRADLRDTSLEDQARSDRPHVVEDANFFLDGRRTT